MNFCGSGRALAISMRSVIGSDGSCQGASSLSASFCPPPGISAVPIAVAPSTAGPSRAAK